LWPGLDLSPATPNPNKSAFDLQLVRRGIPPEALKRRSNMIIHSIGLIPRTKEASDAMAKAYKERKNKKKKRGRPKIYSDNIPKSAKVFDWITLEENTLVGVRWKDDDGTVNSAYFRFSNWIENGLSPWVNPEEIERLNNEEEARRQKREALLGK